MSPQTKEISQACEFLLSKQNADGGWGETFMVTVIFYTSKLMQVSLVSPVSMFKTRNLKWLTPHGPYFHFLRQIIRTLSQSKEEYRSVKLRKQPCSTVQQLIVSRQLPNGDWAPEDITGVFNKNCMISYRYAGRHIHSS